MILKNQAIQTALTGEWDTAITLNRELLKENPSDIEALNRLAFAYIVTGKVKDAKNTYQKVLQLDYQNPIALKNLKRLEENGKKGLLNQPLYGHMESMFIEESGKTKIVELVNVATAKIIINLITGELLNLRIKRHKIFVLNRNNQYIGVLPDDMGRRLTRFINGGNNYEAYVKSVENNRVLVFLKEVKRSSRFKNQPSFFFTHKSNLSFEKNNNDGVSQSSDLSINEE